MVRRKPQLLPQAADFFISYATADRGWAEWIAWQLESAGYLTVLQSWDFRPGSDFVQEMQRALNTAGRTIAVLSPDYLGSAFGEGEWRAVWHEAFAQDPTGERGLLLPVRVEACQLPGLLRTRVYIDLVDLDESTARARLLEGTAVARPGRPASPPSFPGTVVAEPEEVIRFPGRRPIVSNLPPRNPNFSGRGELLEQLHASLQMRGKAAVVPTRAIHGLGGVGKTQLVLEYAHQYASDYELVWWIPAEQLTSATGALADLARRLGVAEQADQLEMVAELFALLQSRDRWLLIYDNAEQPDRLAALLPTGGSGQVLITSRDPRWGEVAAPVGVDVLSRKEAVGFLQQRIGSSDPAIERLAEALGDLPLALEEAAAYLDETQIAPADYLELLRQRQTDLFGLGQPASSEQTIATTWTVSLERLRAEVPAAEDLLCLCAFLAPEVPRELPLQQPQALPKKLAQVARDPLASNEMVRVLSRYSLAKVSPTVIEVHPLVQTVIRARLGETAERRWAEIAVRLVHVSFPAESWEVATWPLCERLLPHALATTGHAERLRVAAEQTGQLLERTSAYLRERGLYRQAMPVAERALAVTEAALGPDHPSVATQRSNLGRILHDLDDLTGARAHLEQALAVDEAAFGPDHPRVATDRSNLGRVLHDLGDLAGARAHFTQALAIDEMSLGPDHPDVATDHNNLGLALLDLGDLAGARAQFTQALAIDEMSLGPDHPRVATVCNNLGNLLLAAGDTAAAKIQYERALNISEAALGPEHPTVATVLNNLGRMLADLGDLTEARALLKRALAIDEMVYGRDHPRVRSDRAAISRVLQAPG